MILFKKAGEMVWMNEKKNENSGQKSGLVLGPADKTAKE